MPKSKANVLARQVIEYIINAGGFAWRANSTGIFDTQTGKFRTGAKKGVSDVLACYKGHLVCIEIKIGKDKLSDEQIGFIKSVQHAGGFAFTVGEFEEFEEKWSELPIH